MSSIIIDPQNHFLALVDHLHSVMLQWLLQWRFGEAALFLLVVYSTTISFLFLQQASASARSSLFSISGVQLFFIWDWPAAPVTSPSLQATPEAWCCQADHLCCLGKMPVRLCSSLFTGKSSAPFLISNFFSALV